MLDPSRKLFRQLSSKVPSVDHRIYHFYTEDVLTSDDEMPLASHEEQNRGVTAIAAE